jgi:hypothetical protein
MLLNLIPQFDTSLFLFSQINAEILQYIFEISHSYPLTFIILTLSILTAGIPTVFLAGKQA